MQQNARKSDTIQRASHIEQLSERRKPPVKVLIKGKNFDVSDRLREYGERKLSKLENHYNRIISADMEFVDEAGGKKQNARKVEVTLNAAGQVLRAEEKGSSFYAGVDSVVEKLERRLRKFKMRKIDSRRGDGGEEAFELAAPPAPDDTHKILRMKKFGIKPMSPEEAVLQMELSGHDFFVFRNSRTDGIAVVYRRKTGGFGLLVPDESDLA
jgi:putative sigma-54 modulation protein